MNSTFSFFSSASLKTVFVDKPENILLLLKVAEQVPTLKRIVLMKKLTDEQESEIRKKAKQAEIEVIAYQKIRVKFFFFFSCSIQMKFIDDFTFQGSWPRETGRSSRKTKRNDSERTFIACLLATEIRRYF